MKIERLMYILVTLLSKKYLKAHEVAELYQVSERTIYRDIDTLSLSGIPIYSKKGSNGGFYIDEDYKLNSLLFSDLEKQFIADLAQSISSSYTNPKIEEFNQKMSYLTQKTQVDFPYFFDLSLWKSNQVFFDDIDIALTNNLVLEFLYTSYNGEKTKRLVEPINLVCKNHVWYLYAFCLLRQEIRLFRVNRIRAIKVTNKEFNPSKHRKIDKQELASYFDRLTNSIEMISVRLAFDKSVRAKVYDLFLEKDIIELTDSLMVQKEMPKEKWLVETLLTFGGAVKVIEPDSLKEEIISQAKNILSQYDIT